MQFLSSKIEFPDIETASEEGLLAIGGDLSEERLLLAYRSGIFPWYNEGQPILWWSPNPRMVLFPLKFAMLFGYPNFSTFVTATWDKSGQSAVERWADKLAPLTQRYNVMVTVHPWTSAHFIEQIRSGPDRACAASAAIATSKA